MMNPDAEKRSLGEKLFESGWKQGTVFSAPSACFSWNKLSESDISAIIQATRSMKPREKFVLISQDCDIVASEAENDEPYIEAQLCKLESSRFVKRVSTKSARWFVIDSTSGLVAHAKYRTQFDKRVLNSLTPEPWPSGLNRLDEFIRWLARRYDRPSIPDALHEAFQRPLIERIALLAQEEPDIFAAFNKVVSDVRIRLPASETPPFHLNLTLLIDSLELTKEEADAIDIFEQTLRDSIDSNLIILDPEIRKVTEDMISLKEYNASRPIYLGDYTYRGDEVQGARPPERN